jgi:hypothetical protein
MTSSSPNLILEVVLRAVKPSSEGALRYDDISYAVPRRRSTFSRKPRLSVSLVPSRSKIA